MALVSLENLSFRYPAGEKYALQDISLQINDGEFAVICGESGCGKTTLLRLLKKELSPAGEISGNMFYNGHLIKDLALKTSAGEIGFVAQNPETQIVTDKVWHELAFGLENLGVESREIRRRVSEMASYFGIHNWYRKNTDELSGGEKQLLNLAAVMAMQPKLLILDEPTSQLDPIAASDFIATIKKLNRELGLTVIISEHRLEEILPIADKVVVLEKGKLFAVDTPRQIVYEFINHGKKHQMAQAMPSSAKIFAGLYGQGEPPLTVREGRAYLQHRGTPGKSKCEPLKKLEASKQAAVKLEKAWFRYEKSAPDILKGASMEVFAGEIYCLLGGNGTGKTTALGVISGILNPYRGKVEVLGKALSKYKGNSLYRRCLSVLPQNPQTLFVKDTVKQDLCEILEALDFPSSQWADSITEIAAEFEISHLLDSHPYDLSGGEQQTCALAKLMLSNPKILLLDEPTKGMDAGAKKALGAVFKGMASKGITVIIVTHDIEFAAENADRCALFFDGEISSAVTPRDFFGSNTFYTTAASRISRGIVENAVTCADVIESFSTSDVKE